MIEKIKKDNELEEYFLNYMRLNLEKRDLPEELPDQKDEKRVTHYLKVTYDFNKAVEALIERLTKKYNLPDDLGQEESMTNNIIVEVCDYYLTKYGEEYIRNYK